MADAEDENDFDSHFLDSMLEVQMTEEDSELDVSRNCDPIDSLPPVPMFDLQSETLTYKDVYRNASPQQALAALPMTASPPPVPLVLQPNPMLIYSGKIPSMKSPANLNQVPKIPPGFQKGPSIFPKTPIPRHNVKTENTSVKMSEIEFPCERFLKEVFRPELVKDVFTKADPPWDITQISEEETKYYKNCFKDVSKVKNCRLHCTICDKHVGCAVTAEKKMSLHKMLKVLVCKTCFDFYGDGNFPCDQGDNCEIYCRWCGQGGALVCCSFCPRVFCKRCVRRNFGTPYLKLIEKASDWACFCCAQKPLWPHRAICRALLEFISVKKSDGTAPPRDLSSCCKVAGLTRKRIRESLEKKREPSLETQLQNLAPGKVLLGPKLKTLPKPLSDQLQLKPVVQLKSVDKIKFPPKPDKPTKSGPNNVFSSKSVLSGNNIIRGIASNSPLNLFSTLKSPQLLKTPVLHGETLITPPSRFLSQVKTPASTPPTPHSSSSVKVSTTNQMPNIDPSKIPSLKIPSYVQGFLLRLILPDSSVQYFRLTSDPPSSKDSFPLPDVTSNSFVGENLLEAFNISKVLYGKLMRINEKINAKTKLTEDAVLNTAVKKLHSTYESVIELFTELDKSLLEKFGKWENNEKDAVDVIDLSDDESLAAKKSKPDKYSIIREKFKLSDDSDVEIIGDVSPNAVPNGNAPKRKQRRRLSELARAQNLKPSVPVTPNENIMRKKRKGKFKKPLKKTKSTEVENGDENSDDDEKVIVLDQVETEDAESEPDDNILNSKRKLSEEDDTEESAKKPRNDEDEACEENKTENEEDVTDENKQNGKSEKESDDDLESSGPENSEVRKANDEGESEENKEPFPKEEQEDFEVKSENGNGELEKEITEQESVEPSHALEALEPEESDTAEVKESIKSEKPEVHEELETNSVELPTETAEIKTEAT